MQSIFTQQVFDLSTAIFILHIKKLRLRGKINIQLVEESGLKDTQIILTPKPVFSYYLALPLITHKLYTMGSI